MLNLEALTDYKIVYIGILDDLGNGCKLLKILVGERGFEPPTPWSRNYNRFAKLLIRLGW
jgi:hypothetical protein